jgi:hypothetical protein
VQALLGRPERIINAPMLLGLSFLGCSIKSFNLLSSKLWRVHGMKTVTIFPNCVDELSPGDFTIKQKKKLAPVGLLELRNR